MQREHSTNRRRARPVVSATVEIRSVSPVRSQALVGGSFAADEGSVLRLGIAHSGPWERIRKLPCNGLLGRPLMLGLPEEFASGVEATLTSDPRGIDAGCLTVSAGAYDDVSSSQVSFGLATELLKWILLSPDPDALTADDLAATWRKLWW